MADPVTGAPPLPGNFNAMSPQQQAAYMRILQQREQERFKPAPSWSGAAAGLVEGLAEAKERRQLNQALAGGAQAGADRSSILTGEPATTGAPPQRHDGTVYDRGNIDSTNGGDLLAQIAAHEISPSDKARLESGGVVKPYRDGRQTSIGFGTRAQPGDENGIDGAEAGRRLQREVTAASDSVHSFAPHASPGWHRALTDLTYNVGPGWQRAGLGQAVQAGDWDRAKEIYSQYNKFDPGDGKLRTSSGLAKRRQDFLANVDKDFQKTPGAPAQAAGGPPPSIGAGPAPNMQTAQASPAAPPGGGLSMSMPAEVTAERNRLKAQADALLRINPYDSQGLELKAKADALTGVPAKAAAGAQEATATELAKGQAGIQTEEGKVAQKTLTGIRGLGLVGSNVEPLAKAAVRIVSDPSFKQTGLMSPENQVWFERFKKQVNLPSSARPLTALHQINSTVLNGMQSGSKSMSTEGGEAARLFQSEISTMQGELPPLNGTAEEQISGWNAVGRRAGKWADDADHFDAWTRQQPGGLPHSGIHKELRDRNRAFNQFEGDFASPTQPNPAAPMPGQSMVPPAAGGPPSPAGGGDMPIPGPQGFNSAPHLSAALAGTLPPSPPMTMQAIADFLRNGPGGGGPRTTARTRESMGLPAEVPQMSGQQFTDRSRQVRDQAHEHPEGALYATLAAAIGPAAAAKAMETIKYWGPGAALFEGAHRMFEGGK